MPVPRVTPCPVGATTVTGASLAPPGSDDIHLWWIALDAIEDAERVLTPAERARAGRFRRPEDRERWSAARAALRRILAGYSGTAAGALVLARGAGGKPEIAPRSPLRFSMAHAAARAVLAVAWEREVGVDLEPVDPAIDVAPLMATTCAPAEQARLAALPPAKRRQAFLAFWTLKEAYLKGRGIGLAREPRAIAVSVEADGRATVDDPSCRGESCAWRLRLLDAGPGWAAALAVAGTEPAVFTYRWPLDDGQLAHDHPIILD